MNYVIEVYDSYTKMWLPVDFAATYPEANTIRREIGWREPEQAFRVRPYSTSYKGM